MGVSVITIADYEISNIIALRSQFIVRGCTHVLRPRFSLITDAEYKLRMCIRVFSKAKWYKWYLPLLGTQQVTMCVTRPEIGD